MEDSKTALDKSCFCIAGVSSGSGKTTVTIALLRALYKRGLNVQPFKCGPDYIDPSFHKSACMKASRNLDTWMMGEEAVKASFRSTMEDADCGVLEGVMGLFDGISPSSIAGSTADIARLLRVPVLLVVNARGMSGSIAALTSGYASFHPDVNVIGVIANNVASERHALLLKEALSSANLPPLLGFLRRNSKWALPERHLGLIPFSENIKSDAWYDNLADELMLNSNIERLLELSRYTPTPFPETESQRPTNDIKQPIKLGVALDKAFCFYYEDNFDMLRDSGFELCFFSPLKDSKLPEDLDAIYMGGGFPELFADELQSNSAMRESIKAFAASNRVIYAECGGLLYLSHTLRDSNGNCFDMCGILPCNTVMGSSLRVLGYREVKLLENCPLGLEGDIVKGHEFHWSLAESISGYNHAWEAKGVKRQSTWTPQGFRQGNTWGSYIHIHFASGKNIAVKFRKYVEKYSRNTKT